MSVVITGQAAARYSPECLVVNLELGELKSPAEMREMYKTPSAELENIIRQSQLSGSKARQLEHYTYRQLTGEAENKLCEASGATVALFDEEKGERLKMLCMAERSDRFCSFGLFKTGINWDVFDDVVSDQDANFVLERRCSVGDGNVGRIYGRAKESGIVSVITDNDLVVESTYLSVLDQGYFSEDIVNLLSSVGLSEGTDFFATHKRDFRGDLLFTNFLKGTVHGEDRMPMGAKVLFEGVYYDIIASVGGVLDSVDDIEQSYKSTVKWNVLNSDGALSGYDAHYIQCKARATELERMQKEDTQKQQELQAQKGKTPSLGGD